MFIIRPDFNIELFYKMNIHLHGFDLPTEYYNKVIANIQNNLYFGRSEDAVFDHVTCFLMTIASYDIQNMENILTRMDKHDVWNYLKKNINSRQTESIWYGDLKKPIQRQLGNGSTQSMNLLKKINDLIYASEKTKENDLLNQWLKSKIMANQLMWRHVLFAQPACQDFNGQTVQRTLCGKLVNTDSQKVHYRSLLAFLNKKMMHQKDGTIIINIENKDQGVIRQLSFSHAVLQIIDEFMMANDDHLMIQILRLGGPNIQWLVEKKWNDRARSKNIELSQHLPLCHKIEELLKDFQAQHVKKASPVQPSLGVNPISIPSAKQKTKPQLEEEESKVAQ